VVFNGFRFPASPASVGDDYSDTSIVGTQNGVVSMNATTASGDRPTPWICEIVRRPDSERTKSNPRTELSDNLRTPDIGL
jgi:hypothetical protein